MCVVEIVRDQLPAGEVIEEEALIVCEDREVNVVVASGLAAEPGVDRPAPTEGPGSGEGRHEAGDAGDWFGYVVRRLT